MSRTLRYNYISFNKKVAKQVFGSDQFNEGLSICKRCSCQECPLTIFNLQRISTKLFVSKLGIIYESTRGWKVYECHPNWFEIITTNCNHYLLLSPFSEPFGSVTYMCSVPTCMNERLHDDIAKWKCFPCYWPVVRGIHRWPEIVDWSKWAKASTKP